MASSTASVSMAVCFVSDLPFIWSSGRSNFGVFCLLVDVAGVPKFCFLRPPAIEGVFLAEEVPLLADGELTGLKKLNRLELLFFIVHVGVYAPE